MLPDAKQASVPIIAVTANAFEEDKQAALDAGMNPSPSTWTCCAGSWGPV